jgi:hypothetical protein
MRRHATAPAPVGPAKRRVARFVSNRLVNRVVRRLIDQGVLPRGWALLETTGRRSGLARRTPVGDGLRGDAFWIVTEHGQAADDVRNIQADPRVRGEGARHGTSGPAGAGAEAPPRR